MSVMTTNKKWLEKSDLNLVKPKFQKMVLDAWERDENVPYGVMYLSDAPITQGDINWAKFVLKNRT
jgi:hypothetical protein